MITRLGGLVYHVMLGTRQWLQDTLRRVNTIGSWLCTLLRMLRSKQQFLHTASICPSIAVYSFYYIWSGILITTFLYSSSLWQWSGEYATVCQHLIEYAARSSSLWWPLAALSAVSSRLCHSMPECGRVWVCSGVWQPLATLWHSLLLYSSRLWHTPLYAASFQCCTPSYTIVPSTYSNGDYITGVVPTRSALCPILPLHY